MRLALLLLSSAAALSCAGSVGPSYFPATNAQVEKPLPLALPPCAQSVQVSVTDRRQNPAVIGQRFAQGAPTVVFPIQMQGDVADYVRTAITRGLQQSGANAPNTARESLVIELAQLALSESVFVNSEYTANTSFLATLWRADSAVPCWQLQVATNASNYGAAGSAINYQETLARVMDAATTELVKAPGFGQALCGQCGRSPAPP